MKRKPNAFQRLIHHFLTLRPVTAFFASKVHLIDKFVLKLTGDKYTLSEFAGFQKYKERAAHRHVPVMVLEPKK
jgi:hypothetical protein